MGVHLLRDTGSFNMNHTNEKHKNSSAFCNTDRHDTTHPIEHRLSNVHLRIYYYNTMDDIIASSYSSFYFTKTGIIIPTVTGSVSFLSSALIIFIIIRTVTTSTHKWSAYYRIIFGLSIADCFTSLATALTTIPMPKDVIYPFEMPSYGNILTCEVQVSGSE